MTPARGPLQKAEGTITAEAFNLDPLGQRFPEHRVWNTNQTTRFPEKDPVVPDVCETPLFPKLCKVHHHTAHSGKAFIISRGCTECLLDTVLSTL